MLFNCLIVDDEPLAREHIASYIARIPHLKLVGIARNPVVAQEILDTEPVDIIFLDIRMPQMNGLEFLRQKDIFQQVIFITAYHEFALDGFELEATDYLMKPVSFERFTKAVEKATSRIGGTDTMKTLKHKHDVIYVKHNLKYEKVNLADILYIESMLNYVQIVTATQRYTVYSSLKNVEQNLPGNSFVRVHKSFIVALDKITSLSLKYATIGEHQVPVSRGNKDQFTAALLKNGINLEAGSRRPG